MKYLYLNFTLKICRNAFTTRELDWLTYHFNSICQTLRILYSSIVNRCCTVTFSIYIFQCFTRSWVVRCHVTHMTSKLSIFITRCIWTEKLVVEPLVVYLWSTHLFHEGCIVLVPISFVFEVLIFLVDFASKLLDITKIM